MSRPQINVTPLIDILLVLLIIFMVISPLKPSAFKARVPSERRDTPNVKTNPETIVLTIRGDSAVIINSEPETASIDDPTPVTKRLRDIFDQRIVNGSIDPTASSDPNRPFADIQFHWPSILRAEPDILSPKRQPVQQAALQGREQAAD